LCNKILKTGNCAESSIKLTSPVKFACEYWMYSLTSSPWRLSTEVFLNFDRPGNWVARNVTWWTI
jgi:hypothetical protein